MKNLLVSIATVLLLASCASNGPGTDKIAAQDEVKKEEKKAGSKRTCKTKTTGSRLSRC